MNGMDILKALTKRIRKPLQDAYSDGYWGCPESNPYWRLDPRHKAYEDGQLEGCSDLEDVLQCNAAYDEWAAKNQ